MFINDFKILRHHGKQYIKDIFQVSLPNFRGIPEIYQGNENNKELVDFCPVHAIAEKNNQLSIDLGKCVFCGDCQFKFPEKIKFSNNWKMASNKRENLIITPVADEKSLIDEKSIRKEIKSVFKRSLKLRQVSAGGDNSNELELGACGNVNFDMGRYGIEFTASPRHADGLVITGPITKNMAEALEIAYQAIPEPKILILAGTDAISGGIFADSNALNRSFLKNHPIDLYVPGNPIHPLTFIHGVLMLTRKKFRK
ncbi:MAG: NADH-quinone oxidoreductase subunit B family protein [Lutibacter sp.]